MKDEERVPEEPLVFDEVAERRRARIHIEEFFKMLGLAPLISSEGALGPGMRPRRAESVREPIDEATMRATVKERLSKLRSARRHG